MENDRGELVDLYVHVITSTSAPTLLLPWAFLTI